MDHDNIRLLCYGVISIVLIIMILSYGYKDGVAVCTNYVFNTYLYIILSLLLMLIILIINDKTGIFTKALMAIFMQKNKLVLAVNIIIFIAVFYYLLRYYFPSIDPANKFENHFAWLLVIVLLGGLFSSITYNKANPINSKGMVFMILNDVVGIYGFWIIGLVILIGLFCNAYSNTLHLVDWNFYSKWMLVILMVYLITGISFVSDNDSINAYINVGTKLGIILFAMFLIAYHADLEAQSKICGSKYMPVPNYPLLSFGIVYKLRRYIVDLIVLVYRYISNLL